MQRYTLDDHLQDEDPEGDWVREADATFEINKLKEVAQSRQETVLRQADKIAKLLKENLRMKRAIAIHESKNRE